jgi:hypothetical protein
LVDKWIVGRERDDRMNIRVNVSIVGNGGQIAGAGPLSHFDIAIAVGLAEDLDSLDCYTSSWDVLLR